MQLLQTLTVKHNRWSKYCTQATGKFPIGYLLVYSEQGVAEVYLTFCLRDSLREPF